MSYTPATTFIYSQIGYTPSATVDYSSLTIFNVSLSFEQNVYDVGSAILAFQQKITSIESATLGIEQNITDTGATVLKLQQNISDVGQAVLAVEQSITDPGFNVSVAFNQVISDAGGSGAGINVSLSFNQNIYSTDVVADSFKNWDISVTANGENISDNLVGTLTIEAERSAARIAKFSITVSGVIEITSWVGKEIAIDYIQNTGAVWRRFTGVINDAEYDFNTKLLNCNCTDDLQRIIDAQDDDQLLDLVQGFWSEHIFNKENHGWDRLDDLLKTVHKSVEIDSNRNLQINTLFNKASADYTFDESLILDQSISIQLAQRSQLINHVEIEFDTRFYRLYQSYTGMSWLYSRTFCEQYSQPVNLPSRQHILDAFNSSSWTLDKISFTPIWPTGVYKCGGGTVVFQNAYPSGIRGFSASAYMRWDQRVTEQYRITVSSPESIAYFGELTETIRAAADIDQSITDWLDQPETSSNNGVGQLGSETYQEQIELVKNENGYDAYDDVDAGAVNDDIDILIKMAVTMMNQSHQQNSVFFQLPLAPYIEINQTIEIDDAEVSAKGIIRAFTESYDFDTGEPITDIELAISTGKSGADIVNQDVIPPTRIKLFSGSSSTSFLQSSNNVEEHIGGLLTSPPEDPDWSGIILNNTAPIVTNQTVNYYTEKIKLEFPAINDDAVLNTESETSYDYSVSIPDNLLTITA